MCLQEIFTSRPFCSYLVGYLCLPKWVKNEKHFYMPLEIVRVPPKKITCHNIYFCPKYLFPPYKHCIWMCNHLYLIPELFFSAQKIILLPKTFNSVCGI